MEIIINDVIGDDTVEIIVPGPSWLMRVWVKVCAMYVHTRGEECA